MRRRDRHVQQGVGTKVNAIEGRCRRYDCVCVRQEAYLIVCWQLFASTSGSEENERGAVVSIALTQLLRAEL